MATAVCLVPILAPQAAHAASRAYTIANYPVEATAADAVTAKKLAMTDGETAAFRSLFKRIVPVTAYGRLAELGDVVAGDLVDGFSVRSERNSATRYIAALDFSFSPGAVRQLLHERNVPFVDEQAPPSVIAPVVIGGAAASGDWPAIWRSLDLANALTPLTIERLPAGLAAGDLGGLGGQDPSVALDAVERAAGGRPFVVATAAHDAAAKRLEVVLAGRDAVGRFALARSYRVTEGDVAYAMELAAVVSLGILEGRWKHVRAAPVPTAAAAQLPWSGNAGEAIMVDVYFGSPAEWYRMKDQLGAIAGERSFEVVAVSPRSAELAMTYPGGPDALAAALARQGLSLAPSDSARWALRRRF
ncbi:MAG: DUF2066 domain-containing protein [Hyphomicrobiaceae bacterium]|nr:DUF2066 domain-containing protein [Hyphomicrobiaceae bacterium]